MILAAGLLVLVGLGLFVAGIATGATVLYWLCVVACVAAGVFLLLARRTMKAAAAPARAEPRSATAADKDRAEPAPSGAEAPSAEAPSAEAPSGVQAPTVEKAPPAIVSGSEVGTPAAVTPEPEPSTTGPEQTGGTAASVADAPAGPAGSVGPADAPAGAPAGHASPAGTGAGAPTAGAAHAHAQAHAHRGGSADGEPLPGEPPLEEVEVTDLLMVVDLSDEVLVVDEHPRYHLAGCRWLTGRETGGWETIALPIDEARTDGFTPCGICKPDRHLADLERSRKAARRTS